jgi:hypothetical protein
MDVRCISSLQTYKKESLSLDILLKSSEKRSLFRYITAKQIYQTNKRGKLNNG